MGIRNKVNFLKDNNSSTQHTTILMLDINKNNVFLMLFNFIIPLTIQLYTLQSSPVTPCHPCQKCPRSWLPAALPPLNKIHM